MKNLITLMLLLVTVSIQCFALSETAIIRHHGDEVIVYEGPSQLNTAISEASEGDILYLGKGAYDGFTINKKIYVRGAGNDQTQINGSIRINIPNSTQDEPTVYSEPILEGLYVPTNYIYLYNYTEGITIQKCRFQCMQVSSGTHAKLSLNRCLVTSSFYYSTDMKELSIINSKIYDFYNYYNSVITVNDDVSIVNSNIYRLYDCRYFKGTFVNSIITTYSSSYNKFSNGTFINTLYGSGLTLASTVHQENCYKTDVDYYSSAPEHLQSAGYLGTDGTVVGMYGGATPFTLEMSVPAVDEARSEITVDNVAKKLNVSIKLTSAPKDSEEETTTEE